MWGHLGGWSVVLLAIGLASGCRFDVAGPGLGAADGGGPPASDADPGAPDAAQKPDAAVAHPDAGGGDPPGFVRGNAIGPGAITIDGALGEWGEGAWYVFTAPAAHLHTNASTYVPSLMVDFSVRWSATTLYFAFVIEDNNVFWDSTELWNDDSVEIYLDPDGAPGEYGSNDHWLVLAPDSMCQAYDNGLPISVSCRAIVVAGGWIVEASVPFASLGIVPVSGMTMGFGVGGNDDDDLPENGASYDGYVGWFFPAGASTCATCCGSAPHQDPWCDTTRLGRLFLDL